MAREFGEDRILATYLDTFERALHPDRAGAAIRVSGKARHA